MLTISELQPPRRPDAEDSELVPPADPRSEVISVDPERMGGTPCFVGTRLPVKSLFDHLESGTGLDEYLEDFEGVPREVCVKSLRLAFERLMENLPQGSASHETTP